jgi:hypothetical protein
MKEKAKRKRTRKEKTTIMTRKKTVYTQATTMRPPQIAAVSNHLGEVIVEA